MFRATMRRAAMMVALPALVAGAAAVPAQADDGYDYKDDYTVHVKVCKEVKKYNNKGKNEKFKMKVSTYKDAYNYYDSEYVKVKDRKCDDVWLKYNPYYKTVIVKEYDIPYGYSFDQIKCYDEYGGYVYVYNKYSCKFKNDYLKVVVMNNKDYKYKY